MLDEGGPYNGWETSRALFLGRVWGGYPLGPNQKFKGGDAFTKVLTGDETIGGDREMLPAQALGSGMDATYAKEPYPFSHKEKGPEPGSPWWRFNTVRGIHNVFSSVATNGKPGHENIADPFPDTHSAKAQIASRFTGIHLAGKSAAERMRMLRKMG
ncbi:hypothetical protein AB0N09_24995 [Streptomyces erythrochromogenes]|uniref:hypothetical protein n=1 Tax=Streptomyces erythrochromogenes TaxID=285574 RepID=UPI003446301D